jgi:hypothetical protein
MFLETRICENAGCMFKGHVKAPYLPVIRQCNVALDYTCPFLAFSRQSDEMRVSRYNFLLK